jgi:hypothetical protein
MELLREFRKVELGFLDIGRGKAEASLTLTGFFV